MLLLIQHDYHGDLREPGDSDDMVMCGYLTSDNSVCGVSHLIRWLKSNVACLTA